MRHEPDEVPKNIHAALQIIRDFIDEQRELDPDVRRLIRDNAWDLYESLEEKE